MLEKKCFFCEGSVRNNFSSSFESLSPCETIQAQDSIYCARQFKDKDFLREYGHIDFIAKEVKYHKTCRARYNINKAAQVTRERKQLDVYKNKQESAFVRLLSYINSELLMKKASKKLVDVNKIYIDFLTEEGFEVPTSDPNNLSSKINEHYHSKIQFHQKCKKQGIYLSITHDAMDKEIMNVALFLREKILKLRENKLLNPITVEANQDGQCPDIPDELSEFNRVLYTGTLAQKNEAHHRVERYIRSSAEEKYTKLLAGQ